MRRALVGLVVFGTALALGAGPAAAAVTRVVDDDKAQCPRAGSTSIQVAVDASAAGDAVSVCNGLYSEQVTVAEKDGVRLRAKMTHGATIKASSGLPRDEPVVRVSFDSGVEVSRFVIDGGAGGSQGIHVFKCPRGADTGQRHPERRPGDRGAILQRG